MVSFTVKLKIRVILWCKRKRKSFPSLTAHRAAMISVSLALSQTPVFTLRDHGYGASGPAYHVVRLFTSQRWSRNQIILLGDRGTCMYNLMRVNQNRFFMLDARFVCPTMAQGIYVTCSMIIAAASSLRSGFVYSWDLSWMRCRDTSSLDLYAWSTSNCIACITQSLSFYHHVYFHVIWLIML